jgi:hypothetical protein
MLFRLICLIKGPGLTRSLNRSKSEEKFVLWCLWQCTLCVQFIYTQAQSNLGVNRFRYFHFCSSKFSTCHRLSRYNIASCHHCHKWSLLLTRLTYLRPSNWFRVYCQWPIQRCYKTCDTSIKCCLHCAHVLQNKKASHQHWQFSCYNCWQSSS